MLPSGLDLVVAAPDDDARMVAQPTDVIRRLLPHVSQERLVARIHAARKHELLPDEYAHLIAEIVEIIGLINPAAPDAQHIHVRVADGFDELTIARACDARGKTVGRNPVAALGEDGHAVDYERETL